MKRSSRKTWLALCAVWVGCSSIVDFDRSKIGGEDDSDSGVDMDATIVDARVPDAAREDTAVPDASTDGGPQCTVDTDCADNELCCESKCRTATAMDGCDTCNQACGANTSVCTGRTCLCGVSPACGGGTPYCLAVPEGSVERCVECRGDNDCSERTDGKDQCVAGACVECDPDDSSSGCENPEPICDGASTSCVGCDATHPCVGGMQCVNGSCFGCNPAGNVGCVPSGSTPICKAVPNMPGLFQCVGCADDEECTGNGGQCVGGSCERCDPSAGAGNAGCTAASGTPICDATSQTCRACDLGDCATGLMCSTEGPTSGRCVECRSTAACTNAAEPVCNPANGACEPCAAPTGDNACTAAGKGTCNEVTGTCVQCTDESQCAGNVATGLIHCNLTPGSPTINTCVGCRPTIPTDCGGNTPVCSAGLICVGCTSDAQCGGSTPACNATTGACVPCRTGGASACTGARPVCDGATNSCIVCDATAGCAAATPNNQCLVVPGMASMNRCVDCINNAGCTPTATLNVCNTTTNTCVDCLVATDCDDANACTTNACTANVCDYDPLPAINDGLTCTTDACDPTTGVITHTSTCVADAFTCTAPPVCSAGSVCIQAPQDAMCQTDMCVTGSLCVGAGGAVGTGCSAGTPVVCPGDAGACVPATGCPP